MAGFSARELHEVAQLLRVAARSEIMPRFRNVATPPARLKSGPFDPVTEADEAAEALITRGLKRLFPGCLVVGEERTATQPDLVAQLPGAALAFAIDPIDGTANFAAGVPLFGVMAAVVMEGRAVGAVILDPVTDHFVAALAGGGAWEDAGGATRALRVAAPGAIAAMSGSASWRFLPAEARARAIAGLTRVGQAWDFRCAAHAYRMMVGGHAHFLLFNRLMPWDHLAGVLLVQEAGGFAAKFDGSAYAPGETAGGLICAASREAWGWVRDAFLGG